MSRKDNELALCAGCCRDYFAHELHRRVGKNRYCDECSTIEPELADKTIEYLNRVKQGEGY